MCELIFRLKNNSIVYFVYYIKNSNWIKLISDFKYIRKNTKCSFYFLALDMLISSLRFKSSFHEYFYYSFYNKNSYERRTYLTLGQMYDFQLKMNPIKSRFIIEDKIVFLNRYKEFIGRDWLALNFSDINEVTNFINGKLKVVLKNSKGQAGQKVKVFVLQNITPLSLIQYSKENNFDLIEEYIYQHNILMVLSPSSLNTIRIITQVCKNGEVAIIGTMLRMGNGNETDNLSTNGIACSIDKITGVIDSYGISFNINRSKYSVHPISRKTLIGLQLPFWRESIDLAKKAALLYPQNRSIGWDIAIKKDGPILVEGNHNWGARLWQMPAKQGLKHLLEPYLNE